MSKRYTETELEKVIRIGCARIDQAVERVCAKYEALPCKVSVFYELKGD